MESDQSSAPENCGACPLRASLEAELAVLKSSHAGAPSPEAVHDLRTPLNSIMGFAQLLSDTDTELPAPEVRSMASQILDSGGHMLDTIESTLETAATAASASSAADDPVDIMAIIDECAETVAPIIADGVEWRGPSGGRPVMVNVPATTLRNILLNLLGNAAKFTERGWIGAEISEDSGLATLLVKDTGVGMPMAEIERLLRPYEQGAQTERSRKYGGAGLGLFIVVSDVRRFGGEFALRSKEGVGTIAELKLPTA